MLALLALSNALPVAARSANADAHAKGGPDNRPSPMSQKQAALKAQAQEMVLKGQATPHGDNKVVKVAKGQYVELAFQGEDKILTVLGEFSANSHPSYPGGLPGPLHNQIPPPDRNTDNTTIWAPDFNQSYYQNLLFNKTQVPSMANWYLQSSSGVYSVNGFASDWGLMPYNEARYGRNVCGDIVCTNTWRFIDDDADTWWNSLVAEMGTTNATAFAQQFDVWDRYDYDGDGNFNEPDGYIDHFQAVHAGEGEETGGGTQGTDAIWSHRWYAYYPGSFLGPDGNGPHGLGGVQIGNSGLWIGDYTVEPENGGVGVFAHEFGHDLGLPDEYDTSGNVGGAENGTGWWTNWSQGSYGTIDNNGLGMYPVSMDAWEKFQLGWLNYQVGFAGKKASFKLGPVESNTKQAQGVFVVLPDRNVTVNLGAAAQGSSFYFTGSADNMSTTMTRSVTLPAGTVNLTAQVRYNIEQDWDYAYLTVNGNPVATNLSVNTDPHGQNFGNGITGVNTSWTSLTADLSAFAGQTVTLGFRYWTDGAQQGTPGAGYPAGFQVDAIAVNATAAGDNETAAGWTFATNSADGGFHVTTGTEHFFYFNAYVAEYRQYRAYDQALQKGPYQFPDPAGNWVEHFPYQDGLLLWYWNDQYRNNNVGDHPGEGWILPIDSHPQIRHWSDGSTARPRLQSYDATFGLDKTDAITVHSTVNGTFSVPSQAAVSTFNDNNSYWVSSDAGDGRWLASWNSVNNPHTGTIIKVVSVSAQGSFMEINLN